MWGIGARISQESREFLHAFTFKASTAATTWSIEIVSMGPFETSTCDSVRQGAHVVGLLGPNSATTGTPNAAAMCAGPLSLPINKLAPANKLLTRSSDAF